MPNISSGSSDSRAQVGLRRRRLGIVRSESALRDARLLVAAKQIIGKLRADTLTRRDGLAALYPNSSQDHQKRAFVRVFAEGWIFLTGEMPGKNRDPLKNPFLRAVDAAWIDWHQEDSSDATAFGEALDAAISSIDEAQLNWLRAAGPGWVTTLRVGFLPLPYPSLQPAGASSRYCHSPVVAVTRTARGLGTDGEANVPTYFLQRT